MYNPTLSVNGIQDSRIVESNGSDALRDVECYGSHV